MVFVLPFGYCAVVMLGYGAVYMLGYCVVPFLGYYVERKTGFCAWFYRPHISQALRVQFELAAAKVYAEEGQAE